MKTWTKTEIQNLLSTNNTMVIRSLLQIYNRQTDDEKTYKETAYNNGIGFNGCDANIMSNMAEFYLKKGYLSNNQINIVRKKIMKYSGQLTKIANKEI